MGPELKKNKTLTSEENKFEVKNDRKEIIRGISELSKNGCHDQGKTFALETSCKT